MNPEQRARALLYLSRFIGTEVPAAFLQKTAEHCAPAGIPHIHSLQEGIYKPKGRPHAFCIWGRSAVGGASAVYPDELRVESDGTWTMTAGLLVRLSPAVTRAEQNRFDLAEYDGELFARPARESCEPDSRALEWHQSKVFRAA